MIIERIQVDEGFLDGLDLTFLPKLNVLIGPRGSGKTSIIELMRFCLGVPAITEDQDQAARKHALSILGSGQVTLTVSHNDETTHVSRTAEDERPRASGPYPAPLIVSQNEIELIGLRASSRMELLDRVMRSRPVAPSEERTSLIRSLTVQIDSQRKEIEDIREELEALDDVPEQLKVLLTQQETLSKQLAKTEPQQEKLEILTGSISAVRIQEDVLNRASAVLRHWAAQLRELLSSAPEIEPWPESAHSEDALKDIRRQLAQTSEVIANEAERTEKLADQVSDQIEKSRTELITHEAEARALRKELEGAREGAGEIQKQVSHLRTQEARISALKGRWKNKLEQIQNLKQKRQELLDEIESSSAERYNQRKKSTDVLNDALGPAIRLTVQQSARHEEYVNAIATALRGSGFRYNVWAPKLARSMSPREFVEAVESEDTAFLTEHVDRMSDDQARRLIDSLDESELAPILTSTVEDDVVLSLFDGEDYKASENLSTGQRCTVVLPILLRQTPEPLILDQPEDHLDNAFIVDTLVKGVLEQKKTSQLIVSTHNANIPVLGDAERVVLLGSDGSRAFVEHASHLEDSITVGAITRIMEGGLEAFKRRAEFYDRTFE